MNFVKNLFLFIITIQVMVVVELSAVKYWHIDTQFNPLSYKLFSIQKKEPIKPLHWVEEKSSSTILVKNITLLPSVKSLLDKPTSSYISSLFPYLSAIETINKYKNNISMTKHIELSAKNFLGKRYVWGATGPKTFDCSGFTQKIYRLAAGINLPRVSREQAKVGTYVVYEKLQRGDMVFFDTNRKETGRVNHVGIYLGDNKFIHASSGNKKVVITNFNEKKFYKNRFLWGRRIIENGKKVKQESSYINLSSLFDASFRSIKT